MPGKILVCGGSGFVGSNVVLELWKRERSVVALSRHPNETRKRLRDIEIDYIKGDVREPLSLAKGLKDVETIIHCVQFPNHPVENPRKGYTYEKVDAEGTRNLVKAAREAGCVKRFIYLSGAGVRPGRVDKPWFRAKAQAEEAILTSGIPYTIFRPSWIYGREDRTLNRLVEMARRLPFIPIIGDGTNRVQPLFIQDLVRFIVMAPESSQTLGKIYGVGGPETLTMNDVVQTILRLLDKEKRLAHLPPLLLKMASASLKQIPGIGLGPEIVDFLLMEDLVDSSALLKDLGESLTPLEAGLSTYLNSEN